MRPRFVIAVLVLAVAVLAALFWWRPVQRTAVLEPAQDIVQPTNPSVGNASVVPQNTPPAPRSPATPARGPSGANNPRSPEGVRQYIESQNVPITFYGKVIDQDSNSLAGANIKVSIRHWTMPDPAVLLAGSTEIYVERSSDSNGRFQIDGDTGDGVYIESFQKNGYELEPGNRNYGKVSGSFDQPVIFKMWSTNIHEKLITGQKVFHIVPDGRPYFINLTDGTIAESGNGDLKVWIKRPEQITYGQRYDWSCEVDMMNGGLLATSDYAMYLAPTEEYVSSFQFEQPVGSGWGDSTGSRRFYVTLGNGQEYGCITVELYAYYNNQTPALVRLSYAINPSGSRILR